MWCFFLNLFILLFYFSFFLVLSFTFAYLSGDDIWTVLHQFCLFETKTSPLGSFWGKCCLIFCGERLTFGRVESQYEVFTENVTNFDSNWFTLAKLKCVDEGHFFDTFFLQITFEFSIILLLQNVSILLWENARFLSKIRSRSSWESFSKLYNPIEEDAWALLQPVREDIQKSIFSQFPSETF